MKKEWDQRVISLFLQSFFNSPLCPVLSTEIILRLDSYSTITRQTRFIDFKSQFILGITRPMLFRR